MEDRFFRFSEDQKTAKYQARARHEHVNQRLKEFSALQQVFRHDINKHATVFLAAAVITQL